MDMRGSEPGGTLGFPLMGGSRLGRVGAALGARSRKQKAAGVAALALVASAPFGGLNRASEDPPAQLDTDEVVRVGPYDVTFGRAYRVKRYLGAQLQPWEAMPVKPSVESRRLLVLEVDVTNGGKRPEYAHTLTKTVSIAGAAAVQGFGKPTSDPILISRADGSRITTLNPGLVHRLALVVEEPPGAAARQATVRMRALTYVGEGGLASNLDEDYWLVLDDIDRRGTISIGPAPAAVTR